MPRRNYQLTLPDVHKRFPTQAQQYGRTLELQRQLNYTVKKLEVKKASILKELGLLNQLLTPVQDQDQNRDQSDSTDQNGTGAQTDPENN